MRQIVILCEYPTLLGGERSMLATLPFVTAAGFEVHVAAPPLGPLADVLAQRGIQHVPWPTHDAAGLRQPLEMLRADLEAIIVRVRPDLVHANSLSTTRIVGPVVAGRGVPSLGHLRDILKLAPQAVADINLHTRLIAVSQATREFHVQQGLDANKCIVIHNGVDLSEFQPRPATGFLHAELGLPASAPLAVSIGQLGLRKAPEVLLSSVLRIATQFPDWHWLLVGERTSNKAEAVELFELLEAIANVPPLPGHVHFLGTRDDVPAILNECKLLVHAARQEPLGRVLLEAAACGLAIVATHVGGTREIFPGEADGGILVPPDDHLALANAIQSLLRDENRRSTLGAAARRRIEMAFNIQSTAARLIEQYQRVLSEAV